MALSWLTALKAVPWADVVQAAPGIVQGARKLFTAAKGYTASSVDARAGTADVRNESLGARLERLNADIEALQSEQRTSAELIRSLAEQNATIIAALDVMRSRMRMLTYACIVLAVGVAGLALLIAMR